MVVVSVNESIYILIVYQNLKNAIIVVLRILRMYVYVQSSHEHSSVYPPIHRIIRPCTLSYCILRKTYGRVCFFYIRGQYVFLPTLPVCFFYLRCQYVFSTYAFSSLLSHRESFQRRPTILYPLIGVAHSRCIGYIDLFCQTSWASRRKLQSPQIFR